MRPRKTPTFEANIPKLSGDGKMAAKLAAAYFGEPLAWQTRPLSVMLARDRFDQYAARTFGLAVPRQNGKSWVVRARCFYGALNGEKILYTCHHSDTSDTMFKALSDPFEDDDYPELKELLKAVRKTNGQQAIWLKNGGGIRFSTRTDSLARGKTYDVLIYDEAQELTSTQQAASLSSISAGEKHNPQTIYIGTPPDEKSVGTVFLKLHDAVHEGRSNMAWMEWSEPEIGEIRDKKRWYRSNPSLGVLVDLSAVESECDQMEPDVFARERLGWWSPNGAFFDPALDGEKWRKCTTKKPMEDGKLAFGVKFTPDGKTVAISWARAKKNAGSYVELYNIENASSGTLNITEMLMRNKEEIAAVCIDGKMGASALYQRLKDAGFSSRALILGSPSIMQAASTMLRDEVDSLTLSHIESPALDESATKSVRREIGRDGWGFGDGATVLSAPIESAALALWAARTTKRNPQQIQEVFF